MTDETFTAFRGADRLAQGSRAALEAALAPLGTHPEGILVFSDLTGRETDLNLSGRPADTAPNPPRAARGRPKLGVRAREVTLLPRHWDWLATQRGGASAALRRLVDEARQRETTRSGPDPQAPDRAYRFLSAIAGDLPGFEAAIRALYANDPAGFDTASAGWPGDIAAHARHLARIS